MIPNPPHVTRRVVLEGATAATAALAVGTPALAATQQLPPPDAAPMPVTLTGRRKAATTANAAPAPCC
jgi:hypothetical protein